MPDKPQRPVEASTNKRTKKAATEHMAIWSMRGKGLFGVHNADSSDTEMDHYFVDLVQGMCNCRDMQWNDPENGCKHLRRVELVIGLRDIPESVDPDGLLLRQRNDD